MLYGVSKNSLSAEEPASRGRRAGSELLFEVFILCQIKMKLLL